MVECMYIHDLGPEPAVALAPYLLKRAPEPGAYQPQFMQALPEAKE